MPVGPCRRALTDANVNGEFVESRALEARVRNAEGSRRCRSLRRAGWVPSVLYGEGTSELLQVPNLAIRRELRERQQSFENTLYDLVVGDQTHRVVPRQIQFHPGDAESH